MPNRILKESICTSDSIDELNWFEEVLFCRLLVNCDDYGRFDGRPKIIKNKLFPLKDNLTVKAVENAVNKLASVGLVALYVFEGKPYLYLPTWNEHQIVRAKRSRYPAPEDGVKSSASICNQMQANVSVIQSNPNPNPNPINNSTAPRCDAALVMPLVGDKEFPIFPEMVAEWSELYPAVDVMQELRNMVGWCKANPSKRKTEKGVARFIAAWLEKTQNRGGNKPKRAMQTAGEMSDDAWKWV